jgi:hypothetical protein
MPATLAMVVEFRCSNFGFGFGVAFVVRATKTQQDELFVRPSIKNTFTRFTLCSFAASTEGNIEQRDNNLKVGEQNLTLLRCASVSSIEF